MKLNAEELNEFKVEAMDLLDAAEKSLLDFDNAGAFTDNKNIIFRAFHSLKGSAGMLELTDLQNHMHILENKLTLISSADMVKQADIDFFLKGVDGAKTLLNGGTATLPEDNSTEVPSVSVDPKPAEAQVQPIPQVVKTTEVSPASSDNMLLLLEQAAKLLAIKRSEDFVEIQSPQVKEQLKQLLLDFHSKLSELKKTS